MNQSTLPPPDVHQQIQLLLPWYVNQSLQDDECHQVESHIRHCLLCHRELLNLRKLADAVTHVSDLDVAAEASFAGLRVKLSARASGRTSSASTAKVSSFSRFGKYVSPAGLRYAMAASILLVMLPFGIHRLQTNMTADFYTLASTKQELSNGANLRLVFSKALTDADIDSLLSSVHGLRVGEPNSVGAISVRIDVGHDETNLQNAMAYFRSRQDVMLVEPILQP